MIKSARVFLLMVLTSLCFGFVSIYPLSVVAQDSYSVDEITPIPHSEVFNTFFNFKQQANTNCVLPCFNEIRPEQTTLSEIQTMFTTLFDANEKILAQFDKPFNIDDELQAYMLVNSGFKGSWLKGIFTLSFIVSAKDQILKRFEAHLFHPEDWIDYGNIDLSAVIGALGEPDEVYVSIVASEPPQFGIVLGYKTLGTVFSYVYPIEPEQLTQNDEPILLCGSWSKTSLVDVWIQEVNEAAYDTLLENNYPARKNLDGIVHRGYWPLDRMMNRNVKDFTHYLIDNPTWCFDAFSYNKLLKSGYSY